MIKMFNAITGKPGGFRGLFIKITGAIICCCLGLMAGAQQVTVTASAGTATGIYTTVKEAFDAINAGTHRGSIVVNINANTNEGSTPATLNSNDADPASYSSIFIQPTANNIVVSGAPAAGFGVIQLNGADNVIINGDNTNTAGQNRNLTINNTAISSQAGNSVIRIATSAAVTTANNINILNCILNGNVTAGNNAAITGAASSSNISFGIYVGGNGGTSPVNAPTAITSETANTAPAGTSINDLLILNNEVNQCGRAVVFNAATVTGSNNLTINQNSIGTSAVTGAWPFTTPATTVYVAGIWIAGASTSSINNNSINNIISYVAAPVSAIELSANIGSGALNITNNTINGIANNSSASNFATTGIALNALGGTFTVYNNTINDVDNAAAASTGSASGIRVSSAGAAGTIASNQVSGIANNNSGGWPAAGINLQAAANSIVVRNNFISDVMNVGNGSFPNTRNANGILINSGSGHKIYHNSIHLYGTSAATGTNSINCLAITGNSLTGIDIRNNIFANKVTGGSGADVHSCLFLPFGTSVNMNLTLNNNAYITGTTAGLQGVAFAGTGVYNAPSLYTEAAFNPFTTVGATNWRNFSSALGVPANDYASFAGVGAVPFMSATDLHIPAATITQVESGGIPVGVTQDIDAALRSAVYPDMGADEFTGSLLDITGPLITYTNLFNACTSGNQVLVATIKDVSGIPVSGTNLPVLYWAINGIAQLPVTGVFIGSDQYQFSFGATAIMGTTVTYYVVAVDNQGNGSANPTMGANGFSSAPPAVSTPPTTPNSYMVQGTLLPGTYNVGAGQLYTSITAAINAYNNACPGGAIVFRLMDNSYPSETYPIVINNPQADATNTLTIVPNAGTAVNISGGNGTALFKLLGSKYVTFNGLNSGGSSLSVTNTNGGSSATVFWIAGNGSTEGASNNSILNCTVAGSGSATTVGCIMAGNNTVLGSASLVKNNNNTISGCTLKAAQNGIFVSGYAGTLDDGWEISNNTFGSAVAAERLGFRGIYLQWVNDFTVTGNILNGIAMNGAAATAGISINGTATVGTIAKNNISTVIQTAGGGCYGIYLNSGSNSAAIAVHNNMISDISAVGSSTGANNAIGIYLAGGGGYDVYYNSVNITVGSTSAAGTSAAIRISSGVGTAGSVKLVNNIFSHTGTLGARYSIYNASTASVFAAIHHNNYYSGSSPYLGYLAGNISNLGSWQAATAADAGSVTVNPLFVSATNAHVQLTSPVNRLAVGIAGLTTDIDGDTRAANPDMGADEFTATACSGTPVGGTISSSVGTTLCGSGAAYLTASGFSAGEGLSYQWEYSTNGFVTPNNLAGQTIASNANTGTILTTTSFRLKVTCANGGATAYSNVIVLNVNTPVISTTTPASRCGVGTLTLGATSSTTGAVISWYGAATGGTALATGTSFVTPSIAATTTYYVGASLGTSVASVGPLSPTAAGGTIATQTTAWDVYFDVLEPTTLLSVDIFPNTIGAASSLVIKNAAGTVLATINYTTTVSGGLTAQSIPINLLLPAGNAYYISGAVPTGGIQRNINGASYPYSSSVINITGNAFLPAYYMGYYNFQYATSCESARSAIIATVTTPPSLTVTATPAIICAGATSALAVSSPNANYTYLWTPGNLNGNLVGVTPATTTIYTLKATDAISGCVNTASITVNVRPLPAAVVVTPATGNVCIGGAATQLTASGGTMNNAIALTENFNAAINGWTTINNSTGTNISNAAWTLRPNNYFFNFTFSSNDASQFYLSNSYALGLGGTANTILQSPSFNLSGYVNATLSFWHYFRYQAGETATAEVSTDGSIWNALPGGTFTSTQGAPNGFVNVNLNMDSYAGQPVVYVRFKYNNASADWYWAIDNVSVAGNVTTTTTWTQVPAGPATIFTDAGASIPYTPGANAASVYVQPGVTTVYTASVSGPAPSNCASTASATITVTPPVSVSIVASDNPVCPSTLVTYTATPVNGGPTPAYQWQVNGANAGTNSPTFTYTPSDLDDVKVIITGNATCTFGNPATSNAVTMHVDGPLGVGLTISANPGNFVCEAVPVTFTAVPSNGGSTPVYQWKKNGINVGTNSSTYTYTFAYAENGDAITCTMTSNSACLSGSPTITSAQILMTVNDVGTAGVVIGIFGNSTTVCEGTQVTVRATPTRPGLAPNYEFFKNGISVQNSASNNFLFTPINGDKIKVTMTSNYTCLTGTNIRTSNTLTMTVLASLPASVTLSNTATLCSGQPITFTANPTNGGGAPAYNFLLNGSSVQNSTSNTYILASPVNGNTVQVIMTSNFLCPTNNPASSAIYTVALNASPTVTASVDCSNLLPGSGQTATLTAIATAGSGTIVTYQWILNGSTNVGTNSAVYNTNLPGSYTVIITNSNGCIKTLSPAIVITGTGGPLAGGTYNIPQTGCSGFDKIATAVNYINTNGVGGAVVFNVAAGYTETAPPGGFSITATGTVANSITFKKNGAGANPVLIAGLQVAGSNNDAVIKIIGGDYFTIQDMDIQENAGNTVTAAGASNTMTEWGIALLYATNTNGPSNNIIVNNVIALNKAYPNSFGIYSNLRHSATAVSTQADLTNASGGNNRMYGNAISNVNIPVLLLGAGSSMTAGNDFGGAAATTANTISNWGSNTAPNNPVQFFGVPSTIAAIYAANQSSLNISWNNISNTTAVNAGAAGFRAVYTDFVSNAPTGTFTHTISNNIISLTSNATGATDAVEAIAMGNTVASAAVAGITVNISNNNISATLSGSAAATTFGGIVNNFPAGTVTVSNNILKGISSTATAGGYTGISNTGAVSAILTVSNNLFGDAATDAVNFSAATTGAVNGISITGAGAAAVLTVAGNNFTRFVQQQLSSNNHNYVNVTAAPATQNLNNNIFSGIVFNSSAALIAINSTAVSANKNIAGNSFSSITGGAGSLTMINAAGGTVLAAISNNNIGNAVANTISGTGTVTGISLANNSPAILSVTNNTVSGLSATGAAAGTVNGIVTAAPTVTVNSNHISLLGNAGNGAAINGINVQAGTTVTISQDTIHALAGTGSGNASSNAIVVNAGTTVNITRNRLYDLSQQSAGSAATLVNGLLLQGGTTVKAYNNFISELKTPAANMATDAIRAIHINSTTVNSSYGIYYNSIYLAAVSSGTDFGTSAVYHSGNATATTATLVLRNNIFDNESVAKGTGKTVAFRRGAALVNLVNYDATSNNNDFYAGVPSANNLLFYDGTNADQDISSYQLRVAAPVRDDRSFSVKPNFVNTVASPNDLHLQASSSCSFDGQGDNSGILIADDIDGDARTVVAAYITDIGADEFNGTGSGSGVWKGVSSNWMDINNWCDAIPTPNTNVTIPAAAAFYPVITTAMPVAKNINIVAGGSITVTGTGKIGIYGSISNAGIFNVADGTVEMAGNTAQAIPANAFQNNDIKNLVISNPAAAPGVSLTGALKLYGKLSFTGNNKTFTTAGFLTLRSTATGTASVADLTSNNVANSNNQVTGDVSVERFITARRAWRFLSVPTQNNLQTIHEAWQENQAANATTPAGYGIHITKDSANWNTTGFDLQTVPGPSMKYYVPTTNAWKGIASTINIPGVNNGKFITGSAYMTLVRGDRTVNSFPQAATTTVLRDKGALVTGTFGPVAVGAGMFAAVGNPYASAIDFGKLTRTNLQDLFYVWDPQLSTLGGYQTFTANAGNYDITPGGGSYTGGNSYIESGQAFFVRSSGPAGTLSFTEPSKVDGSYLVNRQAGTTKRLRTNLYVIDSLGAHLYDGVSNEFDPSYSKNIDEADAIKMINFGENLGIQAGDKRLSVERRPDFAETDTLHYNLAQVRVQHYRFEFIAENIDQPGLAAFLEDTYLQTKTPVSLTDTTLIDFNIINQPGSYAADRFRLVFKTLLPVPVTFTSIRANRQDANILVEWKVENELNIHHYDVEKSTDGSNFTKAGEQAARGTGNGATLQYNWLDTHPVDGNNYYRVRSIGIGQETKLSQVVRVSIEKLASLVTVYPNPVREDRVINISLVNKPEGTYRFVVLNNEGQEVYKKSFMHSGGNAVFSLQLLKGAAHGQYLLKMMADQQVPALIFKFIY